MTVNIDWCSKGVAMSHAWDENNVCRNCGGTAPTREEQFKQRLKALLNAHSQENASGTPDFILVQFLLGCLSAWNQGVQQRENWYGRDPRPTATGGSGPVPVDPASVAPLGERAGWRDIATAPKDGTHVDIWAKCWLPAFDKFEHRRFADCWWMKDGEFGSKAHWVDLDTNWHPTHWMPLPDPPAALTDRPAEEKTT